MNQVRYTSVYVKAVQADDRELISLLEEMSSIEAEKIKAYEQIDSLQRMMEGQADFNAKIMWLIKTHPEKSSVIYEGWDNGYIPDV